MIYAWSLWLLIPIATVYYYRPRELRDTTHIVILILLVISLARPVWDQEPQEVEIEARDIIIALDASYSMRADDISPDRYSFAVDTINSLLSSNVSDNITLILFTTNPLLLSPPTTDHQLISIALESLDRDNIMTRGTSLERLFKRVATLPMREKNLILITDGGEESDIDRLGEAIEDASISLTILALGTTSGSTIKSADGTKLRDRDGNLVVSRINPLLERLADRYGGDYILASSTPIATANSISDAIDSKDVQQSNITKNQKNYIELYQIPLSIAILLFLVLHTRAVKYLIIFVGILGGSSVSASIFDSYHLQQAYRSYHSGDYNSSYRYIKKIDTISLESQLTLASSYYKDGYYQKALKVYRSIRSTSPKIKQILYYNIANTYAKLEQYSRASRYYAKALQIGYDSDALHNLNVVALQKCRDLSKLSISKPSSDSSSSTKESSDEDSSKESDDDQNSGSGGGTQDSKKSKKKEKMILQESRGRQQPQSSKVYELINKGYIYEKNPW